MLVGARPRPRVASCLPSSGSTRHTHQLTAKLAFSSVDLEAQVVSFNNFDDFLLDFRGNATITKRKKERNSVAVTEQWLHELVRYICS